MDRLRGAYQGNERDQQEDEHNKGASKQLGVHGVETEEF